MAEPNLEKVREILLGDAQRANAQRLDALETLLASRLKAIGDELEKRLQVQDAKLRQEIEGIWKRLDAERRERSEALREIEEGLREQMLTERRDRSEMIERLTIKIDEALESLGNRLNPLEKRLAREEQRAEQQGQSIEKSEEAIRDLRLTKMDRSAFAALLTEMTAGLADDGTKRSAS